MYKTMLVARPVSTDTAAGTALGTGMPSDTPTCFSCKIPITAYEYSYDEHGTMEMTYTD